MRQSVSARADETNVDKRQHDAAVKIQSVHRANAAKARTEWLKKSKEDRAQRAKEEVETKVEESATQETSTEPSSVQWILEGLGDTQNEAEAFMKAGMKPVVIINIEKMPVAAKTPQKEAQSPQIELPSSGSRGGGRGGLSLGGGKGSGGGLGLGIGSPGGSIFGGGSPLGGGKGDESGANRSNRGPRFGMEEH